MKTLSDRKMLIPKILWIFSGGFPRFRIRLFIRLLIGISALFGFLAFYEMHSYMPLHLLVLKAFARTLEVHLGLWLATLEIKSRWRFPVAFLLVLSGVGAYFLLWHRNLFTVIAAIAVLSWLLNKVLRGELFDAEPI